jgi:predicted RNA-binding Zn-ribbon protein involved in translation (DUF1610 family)
MSDENDPILDAMRERIHRRASLRPKKKIWTCRSCGKNWQEDANVYIAGCPKCGALRHSPNTEEESAAERSDAVRDMIAGMKRRGE